MTQFKCQDRTRENQQFIKGEIKRATVRFVSHRVHLKVDKFPSGQRNDHLTLIYSTADNRFLPGSLPLVHTLVRSDVADPVWVHLTKQQRDTATSSEQRKTSLSRWSTFNRRDAIDSKTPRNPSPGPGHLPREANRRASALCPEIRNLSLPRPSLRWTEPK